MNKAKIKQILNKALYEITYEEIKNMYNDWDYSCGFSPLHMYGYILSKNMRKIIGGEK